MVLTYIIQANITVGFFTTMCAFNYRMHPFINLQLSLTTAQNRNWSPFRKSLGNILGPQSHCLIICIQKQRGIYARNTLYMKGDSVIIRLRFSYGFPGGKTCRDLRETGSRPRQDSPDMIGYYCTLQGFAETGSDKK